MNEHVTPIAEEKQRNQIVERGPQIGRFQDSPIWEFIKTADGNYWTYHSTMPTPDPDQIALEDNMCWVSPGLCYQRVRVH